MSKSSQITLTAVTGPHAGQEFAFAGRDTFIVGRESPPAHFALPDLDDTLSRAHFLVELNPPLCRLTDLGSLNGTFLNGRRVEGTVDLADGDQIRAGKTVLAVAVGPVLEPTVVMGADGKPQEPPRAPDVLPPGYEWVRELGRGGMGTVHLTRALNTGRLYAVKTVRPRANATRKDVDRFLREIRVLSELSHPHIVAFHQFEVLAGQFFLVMEYVDGTDASRVLESEGPLPVPRAVGWVCQLLDALDHAHHHGFVHRDIKPANLLLTGERGREVVKVADFGLARTYATSRLGGLTRTGEVAGTPAFMPPEQITAYRKAGPAADQYAAAATLYNLLTDKYVHDFPAATSARLLTILQEEPVPLRARRPELPEALAAVVHRALRRDPQERFANAAALRGELIPFVTS